MARWWILMLWLGALLFFAGRAIGAKAGVPAVQKDQVPAGQCEAAPFWTVDGGRRVMDQYAGNVTLVALMELHCSFCRSQIEGFVNLSKMLLNQQSNASKVRFVLVAPWNESLQQVEYYKKYLSPHGVEVVRESASEPVWSVLKGNKDDFFVYDACGRLSYYVPYPQSYLYYQHTVTKIRSTLRQEKCGPCRFITALGKKDDHSSMIAGNGNGGGGSECDRRLDWQLLMKIRAYMNVVGGSGGDTPGRTTTTTMTPTTTTPSTTTGERPFPLPGGSTSTSPRPRSAAGGGGRRRNGGGGGGGASRRKWTTTTTTTRHSLIPTPVMVSMGGEDVDVDVMEAERDDGPPTTEASPRDGLDESTAQVPTMTAITTDKEPTTITSTRTTITQTATSETRTPAEPQVDTAAVEDDDEDEDDDDEDDDEDTTETGAEGAGTGTRTRVTTEAGVTRVPPLSPGVDCSSYTSTMCYRQWREMGSLHACCQRGVYLTDVCKAPHCSNATYQLCCFQKYQQARFQCCHDDELGTDEADRFSRCCYQHFVYDDDGEGDGDEQCCPRRVAHHFWSGQTRVAELCLPNVLLDTEGIVLRATTADRTVVNVPLYDQPALRYQCPYMAKRTDFFYWEPDQPVDFTKPGDYGDHVVID